MSSNESVVEGAVGKVVSFGKLRGRPVSGLARCARVKHDARHRNTFMHIPKLTADSVIREFQLFPTHCC